MIRDLYIIQCSGDGSFKIGITNNIDKRIKNLRVGNAREMRLVLLLPECSILETYLHNMLKTYRMKGEWFRYEGLCALPSWIYEKLDLSIVDSWWIS